MRRLLLYLSRAARLRRWVERSPFGRRLSSRFVAGERLADALPVSRRINSENISVTLDYLGENVDSLEAAAASRDMYLGMLDAIDRESIRGNVSVKLTQLGMDLAESSCRANAEQLVRRAAELGNFVRVDMESSQYTQRTLDLVTCLHSRYGSVGTVIQAYLHRSRSDIEELCRRKIRVRLCKGAYLEPRSVAFQRKSEVDGNFILLMKILLESGVYPAIATHDPKMIQQTRDYAASRHIPADAFEFQMLYGIRRDIQKRLVADGYRLRLYVPFGEAWYPYFMRRLAERPANLWFLIRNLLRR